MNMIFTLAWRNLWRNRFRSFIIIASIALGLLAATGAMALYKGMMKSRIRTVVEAEIGHLQLHHPRFQKEYEPQWTLADGPKMLHQIGKLPEVKHLAPRSITYGMLSTPGGSAGVKINGIVPGLEYPTSQLPAKMVDGNLFQAGKKNQILVGRKLADKMKLKTDRKIVLTFTGASGDMVAGAFRIAGIYQSENAPLDEKNVYVTLSDLNTLLGLQDQFHELGIVLNEDERVPETKEFLRRKYPGAEVSSWMDLAPEMDLMVKTTNQYSYIIMIIIMVALAFGIINTMLMAILERTREIGMMMALGMQRARIFALVLLETFILTLAGAPLGVGAAWLLVDYFHRYGIDLSGRRSEMMSSFGFSTVIYPEFPAEKLTGILLIVFYTALISCLFPSLKAVRLKPVEALRR